MSTRFMKLVRLAVLGAALAAAPTAVLAQDSRPLEGRAATDDGNDWGWIGLLGLAGLAGLMRRERHQAEYRTPATPRP